MVMLCYALKIKCQWYQENFLRPSKCFSLGNCKLISYISFHDFIRYFEFLFLTWGELKDYGISAFKFYWEQLWTCNIPEMNFLLVCPKAFSLSYIQLASVWLVNVIHDSVCFSGDFFLPTLFYKMNIEADPPSFFRS